MLASCGDGVLNIGEECEALYKRDCVQLGYDTGNADCSSSCTLRGCGYFNWEVWDDPLAGGFMVLMNEELRQLQHFTRVWADSPDNVFAVGYWGEQDIGELFREQNLARTLARPGMIAHFDGVGWTTWMSPVCDDPQGDALPAGVKLLPCGTSVLFDVWATGETDVFAVGAFGSILRYDGESWSSMDAAFRTTILTSIWGTSEGQLFAVGGDLLDQPVIMHFDGDEWAELDHNLPQFLLGIWGTSATDLLAVGTSGTAFHFDGQEWTLLYDVPNTELTSVWGADSGDWFMAGKDVILHYNPRLAPDVVTTMQLDVDLLPGVFLVDIWGTNAGDVHAVGADGTVLHFDGNEEGVWRLQRRRTDHHLFGIFGASARDIFIVGESSTILRTTDDRLARITPAEELWADLYLRDIWGDHEGNAFAAGQIGSNGIVLHYNIHENAWRELHRVESNNLSGITGLDGGGLVVVGQRGTVLARDVNGNWESIGPDIVGEGLFSNVWASSPEHIVVAGYAGIFVFRNGTWTNESSDGYYFDVWGANNNEIYAVGYIDTETPTARATLKMFNGSDWLEVYQADSDTSFRAIGATPTAPVNLFVTGSAGTLLVCEELPCDRPSKWRTVEHQLFSILPDIWVGSRDNVLLTTAYGLLQHYDGEHRTAMRIDDDLEERLNAVWATPDGATILVAGANNVYRLDRTR